MRNTLPNRTLPKKMINYHFLRGKSKSLILGWVCIAGLMPPLHPCSVFLLSKRKTPKKLRPVPPFTSMYLFGKRLVNSLLFLSLRTSYAISLPFRQYEPLLLPHKHWLLTPSKVGIYFIIIIFSILQIYKFVLINKIFN